MFRSFRSIAVTGVLAVVAAFPTAAPARADGDVVPPRVESLSLSALAVDVRDGLGRMDLSVRITDNLSGVSGATFLLQPVDGGSGASEEGILQLTAGDRADGTWTSPVGIPQHAPGGQWRLAITVL